MMVAGDGYIPVAPWTYLVLLVTSLAFRQLEHQGLKEK